MALRAPLKAAFENLWPARKRVFNEAPTSQPSNLQFKRSVFRPAVNYDDGLALAWRICGRIAYIRLISHSVAFTAHANRDEIVTFVRCQFYTPNIHSLLLRRLSELFRSFGYFCLPREIRPMLVGCFIASSLPIVAIDYFTRVFNGVRCDIILLSYRC